MTPLLLLALSDAPTDLAHIGETPALCADQAMTQCWTPTNPAGFQGHRLFVTEVGEQSSALHVETSGVRFHPRVATTSLNPVVTEVWRFPIPDQATLTLLPGFVLPQGESLNLRGLELPVPWTQADAPPAGRSYREAQAPVHMPSVTVQAEMRQSAGPWNQLVPEGQTLHGLPEGPVLGTLSAEVDVQVLDRQGSWSLVLLEGPNFQLTAWADQLPEPAPPQAIGYCAGVGGHGPSAPPRTIVLDADTPLYLADGDIPIAHTLSPTSFIVQLDEADRVGIELSTAWGELMLYPAPEHIQGQDLTAFRDWLDQGPLYAKAKDGSCTSASLTLTDGPFPTADLKVEDAPEVPGERCEHTTAFAWTGSNTVVLSSPAGFCESPDGSGSGWMNSEQWTQSFTVQDQGWVQLGGEWLNHDLSVCEASKPPAP